jgi:hypothetical protein
MFTANAFAQVRTALVSALAATTLSLPVAADAYVGTFNPYKMDFDGPQLVTFIDSHAAPIDCMGVAFKTQNVVMAIAGLVAPITACSSYNSDGSECIVVAPISAGVGQLVAAIGAFVGPDALLGHEFRHCRDHQFHPTLLPFAELAQ